MNRGGPAPAPSQCTRSTFDVILAADVVAAPYSEALDQLLESLQVLSHANTMIFLAYQKRHISEEAFFQRLANMKQWKIEQVPTNMLHPDFRHKPIFLYQLRLIPMDQ